ncbi:MAG TPA: hypothetical protein VN328_01685 [Thermodesulfovibrionales bacterium]|nr:hypothetical protein [Thermodesulfovibrionales bacterium]
MHRKHSITVSLVVLLSYIAPCSGQAQSMQGGEKISSRYANVSYQSESLLRLFNKRIKLSSLDYLLKRRISEELSLQTQVLEKIDIIVERVETILEMRPRNFKVDIIITPDADTIRVLYRKKYGRKVDFLAFYVPAERTIYVPADEIKSNILAHELAHAIIDQYFGVVAPVKIHELLADYVTENFE